MAEQPINSFGVLSPILSWFTGRPALRGFASWACFILAWVCWTFAGYGYAKLPGAAAVFGAGLMMTAYIMSPPKP